MNIRHAQYVLTILSEGGFTAAAKKMYISQPSLSQTIKQMEANLGMPIFNRTGDSLKLTYAGQLYVEAARKIMVIYDSLLREIEDLKDEVHGKLRLGVSMQRGASLLPVVIPAFVRRYPHVEIELAEHGSGLLERMVADGQCDVALVTTNPKVNQLEYRLLENERLVLMAARTTNIARRFDDGAEIDITDAMHEAFVSLKIGHSVRVIQDRMFTDHNIAPRLLVESDSFETAKHVAARSNAVMITPSVYVESVPELRALVKCFPIRDPGSERHFFACCRKGVYLTRYVEDFIALVSEQLGQVPPSREGYDCDKNKGI